MPKGKPELIRIHSVKPDNQHVEKLIILDHSAEGQALRSKKRHDLTQALRRFEVSLKSIENGYRFDDSTAKERLQLLQQSVGTLKEEITLLVEIYS